MVLADRQRRNLRGYKAPHSQGETEREVRARVRNVESERWGEKEIREDNLMDVNVLTGSRKRKS